MDSVGTSATALFSANDRDGLRLGRNTVCVPLEENDNAELIKIEKRSAIFIEEVFMVLRVCVLYIGVEW